MARSQSKLQAELKQSKPFASPVEEAFVAVIKTADLLVSTLDRKLAGLGLSHQQYNVLRIVRGAGAAGIPTLAIAERLIESAPGMTRLLDRLEEKGLVRRERCKQDRRQVLCYIKEEGARLLVELEPVVDALAERSFERIPPAELESLIETLERIREQVECL
ncbi:MAG: MarR family transcriptional regulator [Bryobacteraceae bacterium]|nr:MarR family transcriptional regulator [Bryobacteraceae bacterium]